MEFIHTRDLNPIIDSPRETREIPKSGRSQVRKHQETSLVRRRRKNLKVKRPITSQKTHVLCVPDKAETSINAVTRPTNVSYTKSIKALWSYNFPKKKDKRKCQKIDSLPIQTKQNEKEKNHFSKLYQNKKTKTLRTNKNDKERTKSRGVLTFRVLPSMYLPLQDLIVTVFYTLIFLHPLSLQRPHSK